MDDKLPKGWIWVSLKDICLKVSKVSTTGTEKDFYYIDIGAINNQLNVVVAPKKVLWSEAPSRAKQIVKTNDIVFSTVRTYLKNIAIVPKEYDNQIASTGFCVLRATPSVLPKWIFFRTLSEKFLHSLSKIQRGTSYPAVRNKDVLMQQIPLPPLAEQKRIVAKLDHLMGHIERSKERLEQVPALLKQFRQSVLAQAVSGKLTEDWREGKEKAGEWGEKSMADIASFLSGFAFKSKDFVDEGIQLIRMGNLYKNQLDLSRNPVFLPSNYDSKIVKKYSLRRNDILLSLTGTKYKRDYGFAIKIEDNTPLLLNQRILALRPKINIDFFVCFIMSNIFRDQFFALETGGVNQGNVGVTGVKSIKIAIPSVKEQEEIASRVEALFAKADAIEAHYQKAMQQLETLPQAVLAKAFRGELVEQDPNDEPASVLLERIQAEQKKKKPKRSKKKS